ncbi:MAG TPA: hypothetical protein VN132_15610 [Bdellovibrio sp.]|nr:hypothetical protein [Bdellovibrio sp.]
MEKKKSVKIIRIISGILFILSLASALHSFVSGDNQIAFKIFGISAVLVSIIATANKLPLDGSPESLRAWKIKFGLVSLMLWVVTLFLVFLIQLPHERHPHFDGVVVGFSNAYPIIEYQNSQGERKTFTDHLAEISLHGHQLIVNEHVSVMEFSPTNRRIDESLISRWFFTLGFIFATILASTVWYILRQMSLTNFPSKDRKVG